MLCNSLHKDIKEGHKHELHASTFPTLICVYVGTPGESCPQIRTPCRSGYKGFVLGYNSDHEAAKRAQAELAEEFGVRSVCVQVQFWPLALRVICVNVSPASLL